MQQSKLWTKDFVLFLCANFFIALTFYLLMTTLAVYAIDEFDASQSEAGLAASIYVIGALVARLFAGKYVEVFGRKKSLYFSLFLSFIAVIAYFPINSLLVLFIVRFIHGISFGISSTAIATTVMDSVPSRRRGEGTSYFSLSSAAATAVGPFLGLYITQHFDFSVIFMICTALSIFSIVVILFTKVREADLTVEERQALKGGLKLGDFIEKAALPISLMMVIIGMGYSGIVSFINTYAIEINLTKAASIFFIVYAIMLFISRPITGKMLDAKGDNIVIYPAIICFSFSLILMGIAKSSFTLLAAAVFLALGFGTLMSCMQAIAIKVSPRKNVGLATSTYFICMDGGMGLGPFLIGLIIPLTTFRGMYILCAAVILCMIVVYYLIHGRKSSKPQLDL